MLSKEVMRNNKRCIGKNFLKELTPVIGKWKIKQDYVLILCTTKIDDMMSKDKIKLLTQPRNTSTDISVKFIVYYHKMSLAILSTAPGSEEVAETTKQSIGVLLVLLRSSSCKENIYSIIIGHSS